MTIPHEHPYDADHDPDVDPPIDSGRTVTEHQGHWCQICHKVTVHTVATTLDEHGDVVDTNRFCGEHNA